MLLEANWWIERRVIYLQFRGQVSQQDIDQAMEQHRSLAAAGHAPIHTLIDLLEISTGSHALDTLLAAREPLAGFVFVGSQANPLCEAVVNSGWATWCENLSEAHYFLLDLDPSLPRPHTELTDHV